MVQDSQSATNPKQFSIIIPNWNGKAFLAPCLDSLAQQTYAHIEVIIVDNASQDGSQDFIRTHYPQVRLIELPENKGFTGACNVGLQAAAGTYLSLLNNDTEADPRWVEAVVDAFERHPDAGMVASKMLLYERRTHLHTAGDLFTQDGRARNRGVWELDEGQYDQEEYVFSACGGSSAYRREMLDDTGLLDDYYFFLLEDVDLGWRAQLRGWRTLYTPHAIVYHHLSATGGGATASYYDGRNNIYLLVKNLPGSLWRAYGWNILRRQCRIAWDALRAWRGAAARAHLRGMLNGLWHIPAALRQRKETHSRRRVTDEYLTSILVPPQD